MKPHKLYFAIDDSGKIEDPHPCSLYAGILFLSESAREEFLGDYADLVKSMRCSYCRSAKKDCENDCPELKSCNIRMADRKTLLKRIRQEFCFAAVADKARITDIDLKSRQVKRRFLDYSVKMALKSVLRKLLRDHVIDKEDEISLEIHMDRESIVSCGFYDLESSIREELTRGMLKNRVFYHPILKGDTNVSVTYVDSKESFDVQGADILAGTIRKRLLKSESLEEGLKEIRDLAAVAEVVPKR